MAYFSSWDGHMMISTQMIVWYLVITWIINIVAVPLIDWLLRRAEKTQSFDAQVFTALYEVDTQPLPAVSRKIGKQQIASIFFIFVFYGLLIVGLRHY